MRKTLIFSLAFFALFAYGLLMSQYDLGIVKVELKPENAPGFYDYRGVTHVHTNISNGSEAYQQVIRAAQEAGLDFLFFTDLNHFDRSFDIEGYHRKVMVFVAGEYSYLDSRILLFDHLQRHELQTLGQTQVLVADLLSRSESDFSDELVVLAHPLKSGFSWSGAYPSGLDGLEVINLKAIWQKEWQASKISFLWSLIIYPFNPRLALLRLYREPVEEIRLWDELNSTTRSTFGFAGSDATAKTGGIGKFQLKFPAYQTSFSIATNHVLLRAELTGDAMSDRRKIFDALGAGQFYLSVDLIADPKGFAAWIVGGEKSEKQTTMGSAIKWNDSLKLHVRLPQKPKVPFETVLIKDGVRIKTANTKDSEFKIDKPGVYRVIVRVIPTFPLPEGKRWISWIYSNPFYVQ